MWGFGIRCINVCHSWLGQAPSDEAAMASEGKRSSRARNDYGPVKLDDKFWLSVMILCIEIILEILLTDLKIPK